MEKAIIIDPGFSSKLLMLANSAYYSLPRKVSSIREATTFLGFRAVRQLAMTVGVFDLFVGKTDKESLRRRTWWRHSVDTAVCCRWLASEAKTVSSEEAYTCGLLHYIGRTLLDRIGEASYEEVENLVAQGARIADAETIVYGCSHVEVAQAAGKKWGFPESLQFGIQYLDPGLDNRYEGLCACVAICNTIADLALVGRMKEGDQVEEPQFVLPGWALASLGLPEERTLELIDSGISAIGAAQMQI
jgi:HD-like signal output (HDOD) protein